MSLAFLAGLSTPAFTAVAGSIAHVFVANTSANPVPVVSKDASSFKTFFGTFTTDSLGQIFLTGIMNITGFDKVSLEIVQFPTSVTGLTVNVIMGKISGTTLSFTVESFPLPTVVNNHTDDIVGPEYSVVLTGGPANTAVGIQAWVFAH